MGATLTRTVLTQRFDALDRGNDVRSRRARLKREIKAGTVRFEDVLAEPEWFLFTLPICELLLWAPLVAATKRNRILRRADVWPLRPVGNLTLRQRDRIMVELARRPL